MLTLCAQQVEGGVERDVYAKDKLFVSVLAGVTLDQLEMVSVSTALPNSLNANPFNLIYAD